MLKRMEDWLLGKTLPERYTMFVNVDDKISGYKARYDLTDDWIASVRLICQTFIAAYEKVMQNRATASQMDEWFANLCESPKKDLPAAPAPVFQTITLPAGAMNGIYAAFRKKIEFFKSNENYTRADGEDLMIVAPQREARNYEDAVPELKITTDADGNIEATYVRGEFGGLELQYREAGQTDWKLADKSSERKIDFKPESANAGQPVKYELRGIYLLKNKRVGQWTPTYTVTVG